MARKKKTAKRVFARARTSFKKATRRKSSNSSNKGIMNLMLTGALYGAVRPYIAQAVSPLTSKIPVVGNYADEAGMGVIGYFAAKGTFGTQFKEVGKAALIIEAAQIGSDVVTGRFTANLSNGMTTTKSTSESFN